jgi:small subunit ribosomal protein S11
MSRTASRRLLVGLYHQPSRYLRPFSQTSHLSALPDPFASLDTKKPAAKATQYATPADDFVAPSPSLNPKAGRKEADNKIKSVFGSMINANAAQRALHKRPLYETALASDGSIMSSAPVEQKFEEPHHFHINATRHNTHITLTSPGRDPIISVSCGNIGFRKSARKHYDSAFQLASYVMTRMQDRGINAQIKQMEVVLRGFGAGREAVTKALLGLEGSKLRGKIVKVSDATRLKFGGTRSKKPRRLG